MMAVFADTSYWIGLLGRDGLTRALTHDHHFEQAGFQALLRD
jgi:hypothetical protein